MPNLLLHVKPVFCFHTARELKQRRAWGANVFECVACAGDVRCARSLFRAVRSLGAVDVVSMLGGALHVACALGHADLCDCILTELSRYKTSVKNALKAVREFDWVPFRQFFTATSFDGVDSSPFTPDMYAIVYNQVDVLERLFLHISILNGPAVAIQDRIQAHFLSSRLIHSLNVCALYGAADCAQAILTRFATDISTTVRAGCRNGRTPEPTFLADAAYHGPHMLSLFDSFDMPADSEPKFLHKRDFIHPALICISCTRDNFDYMRSLLTAQFQLHEQTQPESAQSRAPRILFRTSQIVSGWFGAFEYALMHSEADVVREAAALHTTFPHWRRLHRCSSTSTALPTTPSQGNQSSSKTVSSPAAMQVPVQMHVQLQSVMESALDYELQHPQCWYPLQKEEHGCHLRSRPLAFFLVAIKLKGLLQASLACDLLAQFVHTFLTKTGSLAHDARFFIYQVLCGSVSFQSAHLQPSLKAFESLTT